ncbi:MAG: UDP-N-acetylmuramoyl-tripeptide--D-alanyl-D-alanine ligase [Clostridia bacterium]|nr:UDP-N-acetylmuramoyl-tripeptide--D-alanyl-D-alanine ligase [Clostridia bacterium]
MAENLCFLPCVGAFIFALLRLKYNLHMLQLNSYRNKRFFTFLLRNKKKIIDFDFILPFVFLIIGFFRNDLWLNIGVFILFVIASLSKGKEPPAKKPLVYTSRIKRLITTFCILFIALVLLSLLFALKGNLLGAKVVCLVSGIFCLFNYLLLIISNIINSPIEKGVANYYINDAKKIISSSRAKVIGITGSYGKTTTKYILEKFLSQKYNVLKTPGNLNTTLGVTRTIREMLNPTHDIFICEMGAKQKGDIKEICDLVNPDYAIISSIGYQHLETFKSIENIIKTKFELVDALKDGKAFLNGDNEFIKNNKTDKKVFYFGISDKNNCRCEDIHYDADGCSFTYINGDIKIPIKTNLLGYNNITNIAGAISISLELGVSVEDIKFAASTLKAPEHRLSINRISNNLTIIDDAYNSNPMGSACALDVLGGFPGLRICITPGMIELGQRQYEENFILGQNAAKCCDKIILVGEKQTKPIYDGLKKENFPEDNIIIVPTVERAFEVMYLFAGETPCSVLIENDLTDDYI